MNRGMKESLREAIKLWRTQYLLTHGVDPRPCTSDFGGYLEISFDPKVFVAQEEE